MLAVLVVLVVLVVVLVLVLLGDTLLLPLPLPLPLPTAILLLRLLYPQALHCFAEHARQHPEDFRGKRLLFWHTGGLPGLETKTADLLHLVKPTSRLRPP